MKNLLHQNVIELSDAAQRRWDVAIVGAGVGGSTAAYALASEGFRVLLIEKGLSQFTGSHSSGIVNRIEKPEERLAAGLWPTKLTTKVDGKTSDIWAPLGCGLGGSSLLYAAALSRLEPIDFELQETPEGQISWPFSYQDLEPYYEQAENLYSVSGSANPLSTQRPHKLKTPPAMAEIDQHFFDSFQSSGLNPYRLHVGVKNIADCVGCGGFVCNSGCKQDAAESCLVPAAKTGCLYILDQTEVVSIDADREKVNGLTVKNDAVSKTILARKYVLAAGAYFSPVILQKSLNEDWPKGLGNDHDQVGRNLMFHISEHIGIWSKGKFSAQGNRSAISLRDFYKRDNRKFGEFQSTGISAGYGNIMYFLETKLDQSRFRHIPLLRKLLRIPAYIASKILSDASVFACILEDFPYRENRIIWDPKSSSCMRVEYTVHQELKSRVKQFRKMLRQTIKSNFMFPMTEGIWLNYGHPCGTCRAGNDPEKSVVDKNCKVHEINNLYIADSSFMPTSGGTNPSLTIAANALRVADNMARELKETNRAQEFI